MRKLGPNKTVRIFTPVPVEMRDQFQVACDNVNVPMSAVVRSMVHKAMHDPDFLGKMAVDAKCREDIK